MQPIWALGLMTGTVLDGNIDIALIRTRWGGIQEFWPVDLGALPCRTWTCPSKRHGGGGKMGVRLRPQPVSSDLAEDALTRAQSAAVTDFLRTNGLTPAEIGVIGFHGQTMLHRAPTAEQIGQTRQLGDGNLMASLVGATVAYDFRSADVNSGGQGAPLAASYHVALLRRLGAKSNSAVLNLGGVSNITWWDGNSTMVAFDTGPAQCAPQRLGAPARSRRHGSGRGALVRAAPSTRRGCNAFSPIPTFHGAIPEIPRSAERFHLRHGRWTEHRGRGRHAHGSYRPARSERRSTSCPSAPATHRVRRRPSQPDADERDPRACRCRACARRDGGMARRRGRGGVLCLPGGASAQRTSHQLPAHDRSQATDDGWEARACSVSERRKLSSRRRFRRTAGAPRIATTTRRSRPLMTDCQ